jgi:hypothetical protein
VFYYSTRKRRKEMRLVKPKENRLAELEQVIEKGMAGFIEVGRALMEIRDAHLYKKEHGTFEGYCKEKWGMSRPHAYRLIDGAKVVGALSPIGDKPATESQARPLTSLPPEEQAAAWREAVETAPGGKATAEHVKAVVEKRKTPGADPDDWFYERGRLTEEIRKHIEAIIPIAQRIVDLSKNEPPESHGLVVSGRFKDVVDAAVQLFTRLQGGAK